MRRGIVLWLGIYFLLVILVPGFDEPDLWSGPFWGLCVVAGMIMWGGSSDRGGGDS